MHNITLVYGPATGSVRRETAIECNVSEDDLLIAFAAGCEKLGVVGFGSVARSHDARFLSPAQLQELNKAGLVSQSRNINLNNYTTLWLYVAKVGNPELVWRDAETNRLDIGGQAIMPL